MLCDEGQSNETLRFELGADGNITRMWERSAYSLPNDWTMSANLDFARGIAAQDLTRLLIQSLEYIARSIKLAGSE